jgi:uncharacterized protein (DUF1800 family)
MKRHAGAILVIVVLAAAMGAPAGATLPNDRQAIAHVLNRMAFGARPGDLARVQKMGLQPYIDEQLHPERIADSAMRARLENLTTIGMSSPQISARYERPLIELRQRQARANAADGDATRQSPEAVRLQKEANSVVLELGAQKMLRAIYSGRQLQEVLTDFWFNHFNVDAQKGRDRFLLTEYERETIRPRVLGRFRDLLEATAKSPAMLFYLDNWMSADPNGPHPDMARARFGRGRFTESMLRPQAQQNGQRRGLNENYGRELMELHTLGVDGGYTQKDVTEVARAFTGWTIDNAHHGGAFRFEPRIHDEGEKVVLGHTIKTGGGMNDGEQVLGILATHPSTAHFISLELTRRFVSDIPPQTLVDRAAARFRETGGDLREVMRTILTSPEFLSAGAYQSKVKTPFEFVVSAVRATGAEVSDALPLVRAIQPLGMPLYQCQPPTGYKDTADAWTNTGALVNRMNFALALASNRLPGTSIDNESLENSQQSAVDAILDGGASETTRATIARATTAPQMVALTLGSPEFQKR